MEAVIAVMFLELVKTSDREAFVIFHRIAVGCEHHADRCVILKLKIDLIQCTVDAGFDHIDDIIFHTRQYNLRFRVAEAGIVLQHFRSVRCQHQAKEDHSFERASFCRHGVHCRLINIFLAELFHFFCVERARRECAHSACIQTGIAVSHTLVVLGACHRLDRLAVHE